MSSLIGQTAPSFGPLQDENGQSFDLSSYYGKQALCIFFYPAAMTYGCTKEACSMRDISSKPTFTNIDSTKTLRIVGISGDPVSKLRQFVDKHNLNFTLLSDQDEVARKAFGVSGSVLFGLVKQRVTFIIDDKGIVRDSEDSSVNMSKHGALLEKWVQKFASDAPAA